MVKNPGIKTQFLPKRTVFPTETRCVKVIIPDDDEYLLLLNNLLGFASYWFNYERDSSQSGRQAANVMRLARQDEENLQMCFECSDLYDCAETIHDIVASGLQSSPLSDALDQFLQSRGYLPNSPSSPAPTYDPEAGDAELLPPNWQCDPDHSFGLSRYVLDVLNDMVTQFLEELDASSSALKLINALGDNVEVVSWIISITEVVQWFQTQLEVFYEAAWTEAIRDEIACDLRCIVDRDCSLSIAGMQTFFLQQIEGVFTPPPSTDDVQELFNWLVQLDFENQVDKAILSATFYFAMTVMRYAGTPFRLKLGWRTFQQIIALGKDESSDEWQLLCDECTVRYPYTCLIDFSNGEHCFALAPVNPGAPANLTGVYTPGAGWTAIRATNPDNGLTAARAYIEGDTGQDTLVYAAKLFAEFTAPTNTRTLGIGIAGTWYAGGDFLSPLPYGVQEVGFDHTASGEPYIGKLGYQAASSDLQTGQIKIYRVELKILATEDFANNMAGFCGWAVVPGWE